ncbi:MAG TPA: 3D domain-containing protein [Defluviitaleaceae bacterium]|nr:3D domain-containing protein [Defluviitaleaceae bacterium]
MGHKTRTLFFIMVMFLLCSSSATAYQLMLKEVIIIDNDKVYLYKTPKTTVETFLQEQSIVIDSKDEINVTMNDNIVEGMTIKIIRAVPIQLVLDGREEEAYTKAKTVKDFLKEKKIDEENLVSISSSLDEIISPHMELEIKTRKVETITEESVIPYETELQETPHLPVGEKKLVQEGKDGLKKISYRVEYIGGEEVNREIISEVIVEEAQKEIIKVGAENVIEGKDGKIYKYKKVLTMSATAYTASYEDTGKAPGHPAFGITYTGTRARVGTVAVDPNVIPLGTKLYIEGYGYAVAEDIGGAIKGNKIDLYYNTLEEARNFGRKQLKVYILVE